MLAVNLTQRLRTPPHHCLPFHLDIAAHNQSPYHTDRLSAQPLSLIGYLYHRNVISS